MADKDEKDIKEDKRAFNLNIGKKMDKVLSNPKSLTKLLASLNVITESSKMVPLSSGRYKTPIGQIATGVTKGIIQGKQIETAETSAAAQWWKAKKTKPPKFVLSGVEEADKAWLTTEHMPAQINNDKRKAQVNLRYNLIFGVKNDLPTGAIENIIAPFRKIAEGLWGKESDDMNFFNSTLDSFMANDTSGLSNDDIVRFQDQFKALTMEQVIQDAKNLYPVSEADVKRLLDAAGDIGTYSGALKNLVSIQKAVSQSNSYFNEGLNEYYKLSNNQTRGAVQFFGANGEIIEASDFRTFAAKYAEYKMGLEVQDALKQEDIATLYKKHDMIRDEKTNIAKLSNFDKLFAVYAINLAGVNIQNLEAIDTQSQNAWIIEEAEKTKKTILDIQNDLQE
jgi:hypothetical protein|tara:strand:- start:5551 stop:6732 length:1182 start_codon:yes stop_codon:yes gene_type:complete